MIVIPGSANPRLSEDLSRHLPGARLLTPEVKRFPDGEVYVRVPEAVRGEHVTIVQGTFPNDNLIELLLLQDACERAGARRITSVVPYLAYARQDTLFKPGESVSMEILARCMALQAHDVITIDPHKEHILRFFGGKAKSVSAVPEIASYLRTHAKPDLLLAPDKGALPRVEEAATLLRIDFDYLEKRRISGTEVEMKPKALDVSGRRVAILDDMISTGGTMATAIRQLKDQGASYVAAACTHGLFVGGAPERLRAAGCDAVLATDTLEGANALIPAAPAVLRALVQTVPS
ncbi:MAG TPA: ribose-phosphate diphosphokinase [Candidatus Thermoplasmatota archaeon]|nr:ribose-phosphate diphosphokinase [Candidatus Thermoplasmatota archaeon]